MNQVVYVSATPGPYELSIAQAPPVQQIIRPTGLMDPVIELRPASNQVDDLLHEIRGRVETDQRVLVTTLTKRMAEDLTEYYSSLGVQVRYLHSEIKTIERMEIIRDLRLGEFDVLVGINLLREGLDIPEVSLVAILDGDKEGFLRSQRSLIQTAGRAARNVDGTVIIYADRITDSIRSALDETSRRRAIQMEFNRQNHITPETIRKSIGDVLSSLAEQDYVTIEKEEEDLPDVPMDKIKKYIQDLTKQMFEAARDLEFEKAAQLRDRVRALEEKHLRVRSAIVTTPVQRPTRIAQPTAHGREHPR